MKSSTIILLIALAAMCAGCSHSSGLAPPDARQAQNNNENLLKPRSDVVTVTLIDGTHAQGEISRVSADSIFLEWGVYETKEGFLRRNVLSIQRSSSLRFWNGFLIGAAAGFAGGIIGARLSPSEAGATPTNMQTDYPYGIVVLTTPFFGLIGGIIGALVIPPTLTYVSNYNSESVTKDILFSLREPALTSFAKDGSSSCVRLTALHRPFRSTCMHPCDDGAKRRELCDRKDRFRRYHKDVPGDRTAHENGYHPIEHEATVASSAICEDSRLRRTQKHSAGGKP
jgi:hypothetical protein